MECKILCIGADANLVALRCEVLKVSGYAAYPASPDKAWAAIRRQHFDLIVYDTSVAPQVVRSFHGENCVYLGTLTAGSDLVDVVAAAEKKLPCSLTMAQRVV